MLEVIQIERESDSYPLLRIGIKAAGPDAIGVGSEERRFEIERASE